MWEKMNRFEKAVVTANKVIVLEKIEKENDIKEEDEKRWGKGGTEGWKNNKKDYEDLMKYGGVEEVNFNPPNRKKSRIKARKPTTRICICNKRK